MDVHSKDFGGPFPVCSSDVRPCLLKTRSPALDPPTGEANGNFNFVLAFLRLYEVTWIEAGRLPFCSGNDIHQILNGIFPLLFVGNELVVDDRKFRIDGS